MYINVSISGASVICSGSSSGNTATFTANGTGPAWASVLINGTQVKRKTLYAGKLQTADFSGSCGPESGSSSIFSGNANSSYSVDAFEWTTNPGWTVVSHLNFPSSITMGNVRITRTSSSASTSTPVYVRAHNSCGWSSAKQVGTLSSSSYSMLVSPNPVSDVLSVLIEEDKVALALFETAGSSVSDAGIAGRAKPVYTIRLHSITTGAPALQASANEAGTVRRQPTCRHLCVASARRHGKSAAHATHRYLPLRRSDYSGKNRCLPASGGQRFYNR